MTAAHVTWRPLGALLVEKGLLTAEELEEALAAQQTTGKRLGQILVDRGHLSGPALTNALAEQYGIELKTEEGFGTGLRAEIERRHSTRRPPVAPGEASADFVPEHARAEAAGNGGTDRSLDHLSGEVPLADLEPQLEEHWARLAAEATVAAREARIGELEAELAALGRQLREAEAAVVTQTAGDDEGRQLEELQGLLAAARREAEERADEFPDRADEWRYTLFYLRAEADIDGTLPSKFDSLVDECFGELLAAPPAAALAG